MAERGELPKQGQGGSIKGGEPIHPWGSVMSERDDLGTQHREIDKIIGERTRSRIARPVEKGPRNPTKKHQSPGTPDSVVPWNTNMLRPDAQGRYRIVDEQGRVHPLRKHR